MRAAKYLIKCKVHDLEGKLDVRIVQHVEGFKEILARALLGFYSVSELGLEKFSSFVFEKSPRFELGKFMMVLFKRYNLACFLIEAAKLTRAVKDEIGGEFFHNTDSILLLVSMGYKISLWRMLAQSNFTALVASLRWWGYRPDIRGFCTFMCGH